MSDEGVTNGKLAPTRATARATMAEGFRQGPEPTDAPEPAPPEAAEPKPATRKRAPRRQETRELLNRPADEPRAAQVPEQEPLPDALVEYIDSGREVERRIRQTWSDPQLDRDEKVRRIEQLTALLPGPPAPNPLPAEHVQRAEKLASDWTAQALADVLGLDPSSDAYRQANSPEAVRKLLFEHPEFVAQLADARRHAQENALAAGFRGQGPPRGFGAVSSEFGGGPALPDFQNPSETYRARRSLLTAGYKQAERERQQR